MSLYANLLNPTAKGTTISAAPVKYEFKKQDEPGDDEKKADVSLRFQPVKRPNVAPKPKPRPSAASLPSAKSPNNAEGNNKLAPGVAQDVNTIERWTAQDDDSDGDPFAAEYNRRMDEARRSQRGGKKNKKKNKNATRYVDWDRIYDPERPTRLDEYRGSEEQIQAIHDWKMRLHAHQLKGRPRRTSSSSEDEYARAPKKAFAPPPSYSFAPPAIENPPPHDRVASEPEERTESPLATRVVSEPEPYVPPVPSAIVPDDASGEDAYLRRLRLSQQTNPQPDDTVSQNVPSQADAAVSEQMPFSATNTFHPPQDSTMSMPLPSFAPAPGTTTSAPPPSQHPPSFNATISAAPVRYSEPAAPSTSLSAAPVHYSQPSSTQEAAPPPPPRPSKSTYGQRLLEKYGWKSGSGLGAQGTGIVTPLRHQTEKRKKRPDAEGGGFIGPAGGIGRIVGGKKARTTTDADADAGGEWSIVAVFAGMLAGVDVRSELAGGDLMQAVGEKMAAFGVVERLFFDTANEAEARVFVKFTSALSAYRAIQAADGKDFLGNGRVAQAGFFDAEKFEEGQYA